MSKRKIVDHQGSGNQKLAITRTRDRSLDSLISDKDKKIMSRIAKTAGAWWIEARERRRAERAAKSELKKNN